MFENIFGRTQTGVNAEIDNDISKYDSISKNSGALPGTREHNRTVGKEYQSYLSDKYKQDFSKQEANEFGKLAKESNAQAGVGLTVAGAMGATAGGLEYQRLMNMKKADALRSEGVWTKSAGLHTGYGFGFKGSFKADASNDWKSFRKDTHKVAGEGIMNSMGFMTKQQKDAFRMSGTMGKLMIASNPLSSALMIGSGMLAMEDPGQLATDQLSQAAAFTGFVSGMRLSGALTGNLGKASMMGTVGKGAAKILGGGVVGAAAYAGVQGISAGIRDITSAESQIGSSMYKKSSREYYGDISQNQATLTARQKALQQVNSSVFNDRGFTLGNEASILRNVSL